MKFSLAFVAALLAPALAAPAPAADSVSMMAASPEWTIKSLKRVCNKADTSCAWTFSIDTHSGATPVACTYTVTGSPASQQAAGAAAECGVFTVTSGWSGQFGEGNGFTTLSVVSRTRKQIIWPAYTDKQVTGGKVVTPDQSYAPAALP